MNIRSSVHNDKNPIPILFSEYAMSMGINLSTMSGCIMRQNLENIGASEYRQIIGRPGRRGNSKSVHPIIYTYNIKNVHSMIRLETLDFNLEDRTSSFFKTDELFDRLCKIRSKYLHNKDSILDRNPSNVTNFVCNDIFKLPSVTGHDLLLRQLQLVKIQLVELFEMSKNLFPTFANDVLLDLYYYVQKSEFYYLKMQYA